MGRKAMGRWQDWAESVGLDRSRSRIARGRRNNEDRDEGFPRRLSSSSPPLPSPRAVLGSSPPSLWPLKVRGGSCNTKS